MGPTGKSNPKGGRLSWAEEDERLAYAVECVRSIPDPYRAATQLMTKYGVKRRRAVKWLARARERIRRKMDEMLEVAAAELWLDVREGISACRRERKYRDLFRGIDVAAKLLPQIKHGDASDLAPPVTEIRMTILDPANEKPSGTDANSGHDHKPEAGGVPSA